MQYVMEMLEICVMYTYSVVICSAMNHDQTSELTRMLNCPLS